MSGLGMVGGAVGGAMMGLAQDEANYRRQRDFYNSTAYDNQQRSKEMSNYNADVAYDMWKKTGIKGQMQQLKEAGMNPGLMYGSSASGGSTTVATGGSEGALPTVQNNGIMGMQLGLQAEATSANIDLTRATADKVKAEAENLRGVDRENTQANTNSLLQGINNQKAQEELTKIQGNVMNVGMNKTIEEIRALGYQNNIDSRTINEKIKIIKNEAVGGVIRNNLAKAQIINTSQMTTESKARIDKMAEDISQGWENLRIQEKNSRINQFKEELKSEYPSIMEVTGKLWNDMFTELDELFGDDEFKNRKVK